MQDANSNNAMPCFGSGNPSSPMPRIVPFKSTEDFAAEIRTALREKLEAVVVELNKAQQEGLVVNFSLARNQFGLQMIQSIDIFKVY